jgi:hypothetical protein
LLGKVHVPILQSGARPLPMESIDKHGHSAVGVL